MVNRFLKSHECTHAYISKGMQDDTKIPEDG